MANTAKVDFVGALTEKLKGSQSIVLADFKGITVAEITELRTTLRKEGVELKVIKNRLGKRALADANYDSLDPILKGNTIWAFGLKDAVAPARLLTAYAKDHEKFVIKGGILEGKKLDASGVKQLSSMPNRKELLSIMAGDLKQPATKLAGVMQAGLTKVLYAFSSLEKKLGEAA